ncbi:MAG: NAD(P)-dependent alcohol dehydrogenase [Bacteroidota bacterium]
MKAITRSKYGGPDILQIEEVEKPVIKAGHILVKVSANSVNPADWHTLRGTPFFIRFSLGLFKPKDNVLGADFSGIVEDVGDGVTNFKPGDSVFGENLKAGAFAAYTLVPAEACAKVPDGVDLKSIACVPVAALTALQGLITHGKLEENETVLINGSSGGVGHFTVQIAKAYGAEVTAVCSAKNMDFVKGIGADEVLAYDEVNIHKHQGKYDLVVDTHGNLTHSDYKRMGSRGVMVGFTSMGSMMKLLLKRALSKYPLAQFVAEANTADLDTLADLISTGKMKVHIDRTYPYQKIPEAIDYIEAMRTRGKVAILWE